MGEVIAFPDDQGCKKVTKIIVERAPTQPWVFLVFVKDEGWYEQDYISAHQTYESALHHAHNMVPLFADGYVCDEVT